MVFAVLAKTWKVSKACAIGSGGRPGGDGSPSTSAWGVDTHRQGSWSAPRRDQNDSSAHHSGLGRRSSTWFDHEGRSARPFLGPDQCGPVL